MKNLIKKVSLKIVLFAFLFTSINVFSQNKNIKINAEKVAEGYKITTTENGKKTVVIYNTKKAEEYLNSIENINIDLKESGENSYTLSYSTDGEETKTIEIDIDDVLNELGVELESLGDDLESLIDRVSSNIEYTETEDEDGNKTIKITSKTEK